MEEEKNPFIIKIRGNSGNCIIKKEEENYICDEIKRFLEERGLNIEEVKLWR